VVVGATAAELGSKVSVVCPCGSRGLFPRRLAGRKIKCRECAQVLRVPAEWQAAVTSGASTRWVMKDSEEGIVLTPLALCDSDELRLLPAHERKLWDEAICRPGMRRSPAEVRNLEARGQQHLGVFANDAEGGSPTRPRTRRGSGGSSDPSTRHHGHVKAIAFWYRIAGILLALGAVGGSLFLNAQGAPAWISGTLFLVGLGFAALNYGLGYGLGHLHAWGRWITIALTGINGLSAVASLFAVPSFGALLIGLLPIAWNAAVLWALHGSAAKVVFGDYRETAPKRVRFVWSPFFWIPAILIGLSLAAGVALVVATIVVV
jgi:hypothetical protein